MRAREPLDDALQSESDILGEVSFECSRLCGSRYAKHMLVDLEKIAKVCLRFGIASPVHRSKVWLYLLGKCFKQTCALLISCLVQISSNRFLFLFWFVLFESFSHRLRKESSQTRPGRKRRCGKRCRSTLRICARRPRR